MNKLMNVLFPKKTSAMKKLFKRFLLLFMLANRRRWQQQMRERQPVIHIHEKNFQIWIELPIII